MSKIIDILPDSISQLSKSAWWTVGMWVTAFVIQYFMGRCGETWLAFAACASLVAVGMLPLKEDSKNIAHYVFAVSSAVLSQWWCWVVGDWRMLVVWWIAYAVLLPVTMTRWCFVAEVWCIISVLLCL